MTDTPDYYQLETGDLYDLFVSQRGLDVVRQHLEMAALEYLWRCRHKGQYLRDLEKVKVIVDRLIDMADHEATIQDTLDKALLVLGQAGWGVVPPPAPQATNGTPASDSSPALREKARQETVLAYCVRVEEQRQGVAVPVEIQRQLDTWGIPPDRPYCYWSGILAAASGGRYPEEVPHATKPTSAIADALKEVTRLEKEVPHGC